MPTPRLDITIRNADFTINKLYRHIIDSTALEAKFQQLIAELILLRLFALFEDAIAEIAYKIASGSIYTNGIAPSITIKSSNMSHSRTLFLNHGRTKPVSNLKWTKSKYIRDSVKHVIPITEQYIVNIGNHAATIDEIRKVRNVVAHRTVSAKTEFKQVVRSTYGANVPISPGSFLTSTTRTPSKKIFDYLTSIKIILSDAAKG